MMRPDEIQSAVLSPLLGQSAWGIKLGVGTFLTIEFGTPTQGAHGEWHLWLYSCAWRIEMAGAVITGSGDDPEDAAREVQRINDRVLQSVGIEPSGDSTWRFDGGVALKTWAISTDSEHWMLFTPDGMVLTSGPGAVFKREQSGAQ